MDPNATLTNLRALAQQISRNIDADLDPSLDSIDELFLVGALLNLDEWLRKGGSLPTDWGGSAREGDYPSFVDPTV